MSAKIDRIRQVLAGGRPDSLPFSVWTHFPGIDLDPERLAETSAGFCREFDLDFVKTMSNGLFSVEDWGCVCDFNDIASGGVAKVTRHAIRSPGDWDRIGPLDVERGALGRELRSLRILLGHLKGDAVALATVFSPLTTAQKLAGPAFIGQLRENPEGVKRALAAIADTTARFAARAVELGAAGLYLASQLSQRGELSEAEYAEFGVPYDLRVLGAVRDRSWFNVMHIHGDGIMFDLLKDYPVQGISWHVWETEPGVEDFLAGTKASIVGGLRRYRITEGDLPEIAKDLAEMRRLTGGRRLFLAPGCVIRAPYDRATLRFIKDSIRQAD